MLSIIISDQSYRTHLISTSNNQHLDPHHHDACDILALPLTKLKEWCKKITVSWFIFVRVQNHQKTEIYIGVYLQNSKSHICAGEWDKK